MAAPHRLPERFRSRIGAQPSARVVCDYIAGMTDRFCAAEHAELVAARRRIRELETELAAHRRSAELLKEQADPKAGSQPSK